MPIVRLSRDQSDLDSNFARVANQLSSLLEEEGYRQVAFRPGLHLFKALSDERKKRVLESLESYTALCVEHQSEHQSLRDSRKFTWRAMRKFGLTPDANLMDRITDEDVVEIYSGDHVQLFRNFEFFGISSYTLEQLFCLEWYSLFQRDHAHSEQILDLVNKLFAGAAPAGFSHAVPEHIVIESCSEGRFRVNYKMQHFAPLYKNRKVEAIVSIVRAHILD